MLAVNAILHTISLVSPSYHYYRNTDPLTPDRHWCKSKTGLCIFNSFATSTYILQSMAFMSDTSQKQNKERSEKILTVSPAQKSWGIYKQFPEQSRTTGWTKVAAENRNNLGSNPSSPGSPLRVLESKPNPYRKACGPAPAHKVVQGSWDLTQQNDRRHTSSKDIQE